ncbi:tripartite tricarboxylate transporter substrate binding protein [soil metagenome]
MHQRRDLLKAMVLAGLPAGMARPAMADDAWPAHALTMIVPFPPGGVGDITARPVAEAMGRALKQAIIVESRAGAGGAVGTGFVARARPDGYTLLLTLSSYVVLPEADKVLERAPLYALNQFKAIARFTADPTVLTVNASSPWKTYQDFIEAVRAAPNKYTFGSSGNYGTMQVPMEQLKIATGTKMLHVPYNGAGPAVVSLLGGQVDAISTGPSTIAQQVAAGKLRPLAHWGTGRIASLPDVPSLTELGVPIQYSQWTGLFVPSATPPDVVAKLSQAAKFAAEDPRVAEALNGAGSVLRFMDMQQFEPFIASEATSMAAVVKAIGKVE